MKLNRFFSLLIFTVLFLGIFVPSGFPHAGEDHGPKVGDAVAATGPVTLTSETIKNLGIETADAKIEPLQRTLKMVATIEPLPEHHAKISARFEGRVIEIVARLGQEVKKGDVLLKLDPITIGNPPVLLRSPIHGYVTMQNSVVGQTFTTDTVLVEVANYQQVLAKGVTFENPDLNAIKVGASARVIVDIYPNQTFQGTVQRVDAGIERETHTFDVFALLENQDLKLKPNLQASLYVGLGEAQEVLSVPKRAVLGDIGNTFVFVQEKDTFEKRPVVLGIQAGDRVEILEGVFPDEKVVVQGNYQLQFASGKPKAAAVDHHDEASGHSGRWWKWSLGLLLIGFMWIVIRRLLKRGL